MTGKFNKSRGLTANCNSSNSGIKVATAGVETELTEGPSISMLKLLDDTGFASLPPVGQGICYHGLLCTVD